MPRRDEQTRAIDQWLGKQLQFCRLSQGVTRLQLAIVAEITVQQLDKYEQGRDRIAVGRLVLLARGLNLRLDRFWAGLNIDRPVMTAHQQLRLELAKNFMKLHNPCQQKAVNNLIRLLARDTS